MKRLFTRVALAASLLCAVVLSSLPLTASGAGYSAYLANNLVDRLLRGQAFTFPSTVHVGVLTSTTGPRANSTAYAANATMTVTAADTVVHLYRTSASCTSAASAPSFPGLIAETVTDGTCSWVEQTNTVRAGTAAEGAWTGYSRTSVAASLANWAGTQGAGTTAVSSGNSATTSNNNIVTIGGAVTSGPSYAWAIGVWDASTSGNLLIWVPLTTVRTINNGDGAPSIAAGALQIFVDR